MRAALISTDAWTGQPSARLVRLVPDGAELGDGLLQQAYFPGEFLDASLIVRDAVRIYQVAEVAIVMISGQATMGTLRYDIHLGLPATSLCSRPARRYAAVAQSGNHRGTKALTKNLCHATARLPVRPIVVSRSQRSRPGFVVPMFVPGQQASRWSDQRARPLSTALHGRWIGIPPCWRKTVDLPVKTGARRCAASALRFIVHGNKREKAR
jgi:hypothetical protein